MADDDPFSWWEDKQVAVRIDAALVRGWVLSCHHVAGLTGEGVAGQMTIVLLIADPVVAAIYPDELVVAVVEDGGHGRPQKIRGMWADTDLADVRTTPAATTALPLATVNVVAARRRPLHRAGMMTVGDVAIGASLEGPCGA